jgi:hypothetical protein
MAVVKATKGALSPTKTSRTPAPEEKEAFTLAKELSTPVPNLGGYIMLLFGAKKIGKTTLTAQFPNTYHMMFEPGGKALSIYQDLYSTWARVKRGVALLETDNRFETVSWDPVDIAFKLCEKFTNKELGVTHPSEADWGKGWARLRDEFTLTVNRLANSGKGIVLVSHDTVKEITKRDGGKYDVVTSTMPGMARDIIEGLVDIWAYYGYEGDRRMLYIRGDDHLSAGHRLTNHFTWKGEAVRAIDMGSTAEEAYANFTACFNNQYNPADYAPAHETEDHEVPATLKKKTVIKKLKRS